MKFNYLSYPQMVNDALLTAEFVQSLPLLISKVLNITADDVIVVTITSATSQSKSSSSPQKRDLSDNESASNSGVIVSMAIPGNSVPTLKQLVATPNSQLYDSSNGQLATLIDSSYFQSSNSGKSNKVANHFFYP